MLTTPRTESRSTRSPLAPPSLPAVHYAADHAESLVRASVRDGGWARLAPGVYVDAEIASDYRAWLVAHVEEMLTFPGFLSAECFEAEADHASARAYCVQYRLLNVAALDDYLREQAPRMRAQAESRFGGRFSASRRLLQPFATS